MHESGNGGAESFSQLPSSESSCQHKPTLTSTKSRWKFYTEVGHRSFHTAWAQNGHGAMSDLSPLSAQKRTSTSPCRLTSNSLSPPCRFAVRRAARDAATRPVSTIAAGPRLLRTAMATAFLTGIDPSRAAQAHKMFALLLCIGPSRE